MTTPDTIKNEKKNPNETKVDKQKANNIILVFYLFLLERKKEEKKVCPRCVTILKVKETKADVVGQ